MIYLRALFILISMFLTCQGSLYSQDHVQRDIGSIDLNINISWTGSKAIPTQEGQNYINIPWFTEAFLHDSLLLPEFRLSFLPNRQSLNAFEVERLQWEEEFDVNILQALNEAKPDGKPELRSIISRKSLSNEIRWLPFFEENGKWYRINSAKLIPVHGAAMEEPINLQRTYKQASVLATGKWYKIAVKSTGIYKITYSDMQTMGFDVTSLDPRNIAIYGNGGGMLPELNSSFRQDDLLQNAIYVEGESDGSFDPGDYILFYAESPHTWAWYNSISSFSHIKHLFDDRNCYFVTLKSDPGLRLQTESSSLTPATHTVTNFNDRSFHDLDSNNLIKSGREWYGEEFFNGISYQIPFSFQNLVPGSRAFLRSSVAARSTVLSSFTINTGTAILSPVVQQVTPSYNSEFARASHDTMSFIPTSGNITVEVTYNSTNASAKGWLNYIQINALRQLQFTGSQMAFRNVESVDSGNVSNFIVSASPPTLKVWDVSETGSPVIIAGTYSSNSYEFTLGTDSLREFICFDGSSFQTPSFVGPVANQNLHGLGQHDMIILTHPDFREQADRLANLHSSRDMLSVLVIEPQYIYNEFSSGVKDITAIRDFMKMFYDRAVIPDMAPRYLLLMGDASYDPKQRLEDNTDFLPTFQSSQSLHPAYSYATDDYFGILDDNEGIGASGHLDIGIGRFPVQTLEEATAMVDKVFRYIDKSEHPGTAGVASSGDWRNVICFVADDEDGNGHMIQANSHANYVDTAFNDYNIDKIYIDAFQQVSASGGQRYPEAQAAINRRVAKGALMINYTGHGGEVGWSLERILEVADINSWENYWNMPSMVTATCEFSRYDDPERVSAGELVFLNEGGGGISLFTTSRLAFSNTNFNLNQSLLEVAFPKTANHPFTMGDIIRLAKVGAGSPSSNRNFLLIGDPALKLSYPDHRVSTTEINGSSVSTYTDTLRALSTVTVSGEITDWQGNKLSGFNGVVYPTVFDKASVLSTLGNDPGSSPTSFTLQKNILYKGKASVVNGEFSFTFVVPKDIAYTFGNGRISYYANDGQEDANGYFEGFIVGGTSPSSPVDTEGPQLSLFMNDTNFIDGGITDESPVLLVFIKDLNGINTVGNGIGHDIIATLDGNTSQPYILNDFYESDLDSYNSGKVRYPLSNLSSGSHVMTVRAWDVFNNSATDSIHFIVNPSGSLVLQSVSSYPNPFSSYSDIWFEHNMPGDDLSATVQIISLQGQLVKTFENISMGDGYMGGPVRWYGQSDNGNFVGNGLYFYRISLLGKGEVVASRTGKLILIR